jgi:hypothetical protein
VTSLNSAATASTRPVLIKIEPECRLRPYFANCALLWGDPAGARPPAPRVSMIDLASVLPDHLPIAIRFKPSSVRTSPPRTSLT